MGEDLATELDLTTSLGELHGVGQQVQGNLLKTLGVDFHKLIIVGELMADQAHVLELGSNVLGLNDLSEHIVDVNPLDVLDDLARADLGEIEQVLHVEAEEFRTSLDVGFGLLHLGHVLLHLLGSKQRR